MQIGQDQKNDRIPLHVEVVIQSLCPIPLSTIHSQWLSFVNESGSQLTLQNDFRQINLDCIPSVLRDTCVKASVSQDDQDDKVRSQVLTLTSSYKCQVHVFKLKEEEVRPEEIEAEDDDDESMAVGYSLSLPHVSLDGLWESLILEPTLKQRLLNYALSALLFSDRGVSSHLVPWNRILLMHGVSGTGKTSLCRGLAHKLAIRMGDRFPLGAMLVDVRAHFLFSASGKLVRTLFQTIQEDIVQEEPNTLVCVLLDDVESLASARTNHCASGDPANALRAVNSLLTSLDQLRSFPNVLILATTKLKGSLDMTFVDRADLKIHIGLPILKARYEILRSSIVELQRVGIIGDSSEISSFDEQLHQNLSKSSNSMVQQLLECAQHADGLSGRALRRLPLQSHAQFLGRVDSISTTCFLEALLSDILLEQSCRNELSG